jgi:hypothetical protein
MRLISLLFMSSLAICCLSGCNGNPATGPSGKPGAATPENAEKKTLVELRAERDQLKELLDQKNAEIEKAVVARRQRACHWLQAGLGVLAAACLVLGWIFRPLLWRFAALATGCVVLIILLAFVAWLAPWWPWIGAGILLLTAGIIILYWQRDHRTAGQIIAAIEEWKAESQAGWKGLKPKLEKFTDTGIKRWIEKLVPAK